ncbi:hypothetical protein Tco_1155879 [Tanacetum coccineum]
MVFTSIFLENPGNQKGDSSDWMFDLDLLTPSMNYIPVRKENYADSGDKVSTLGDVEDLALTQFIVPTDPAYASRESLAKAHNDDQKGLLLKRRKRGDLSIAKGKEHRNPRKVFKALADESWAIEVCARRNFFNSRYMMYGSYVDLPGWQRVIGTKWGV